MSSTALATLRENLGRFLTDAYGSAPVDADGDFHVERGPVRVWLRPIQAGEGATVVLMWSASNIGMRLDADLTRYLATEATKLSLSQFEIQTSGPTPAVMASYALLGDYLSREELQVAVEDIAATVREHGPKIAERFGGSTQQARPPTTSNQITPETIQALAQAAGLPSGGPARGSARTRRWQTVVRGVFGALGLAGGIWGGWYAWTRTDSLWLVAYVFFMTLFVVSRGLADVITDPQKVRRAIFFLLGPALSIATVWFTYRLWELMWLSTILGFFLALPIGLLITRAVFPTIALEEDQDTEERKRA